ncbi:hypothetical protein ACVA51_13080 [Pseudomonas luteola]
MLIQYARLYAVPLDYICGLIDDPISDHAETNQGVIANVLSEVMHEQFANFVKAISEQASVTIAGFNQDRRDLQTTCNLAHQARAALERVRQLNPEFDEDWRGTASLIKTFESLSQVSAEARSRLERETHIREVAAANFSLTNMDQALQDQLAYLRE